MIVRAARVDDAAVVIGLIGQLGYSVDIEGVEFRLLQLAEKGEPILVAERDGMVVGLLNWHVMVTIHRPLPVGRIVTLVVDKAARGLGIGTLLVAEAERRTRDAGCGMLEVTSNLRLVDAHRFYERLGFERTSRRFAKTL